MIGMKNRVLAVGLAWLACALPVHGQYIFHRPAGTPIPRPAWSGSTAPAVPPTFYQGAVPPSAAAPPTLDDVVRRLEATEAELQRLRHEAARGQAEGAFQPVAGYRRQPGTVPEGALPGPPEGVPAAPLGPLAPQAIPDVDPLPNPEYDRQEFDEGPISLDAAAIPGGRFSVRPRGRVLFDTIFFDQSQTNMASVAQVPGNRNLGNAPDFVGFNQARIGVEGEGYGNIFYEAELDIAGSGRPSVTDMYIGVADLPILGTLFVGNQRIDASLERVHSIEHLVFMERAVMQALVPGRRPGVKFRNFTPGGRASWALGLYRNGDDDFGNTLSNQGNWLVASRATFLPWYDETSEGRYWWHLGGSALFAQPADNVARFRTRPEVGGIYGLDDGIRIPFFVSTDQFAAERTQLLGAETALNLGALNLQSEYMVAQVDRAAADGLTFWGGYVQASYFLTGETRVYRRNRGTYGRVRPYEDFFSVAEWPDNRLICGRGAWQIAARLSHIDLIDGNIQGGRLTDVTAGVNWYLNRRTRLQFNYIHALLDYRGVDSDADIFASRFSIFF